VSSPYAASVARPSQVAALSARVRALTLPAVVLGVFAGGWALVLGWIAVDRHESIRSHRFDLGNMVQVVWSTAHGRPFDMTLGTGEQGSRLGVHVDPILGLFAPLWWIFPTPLLLVVVQVLALAVGALPVYWLGRRHLGSGFAALGCALAYLLYIPVAWNAVADFHPVTLAVPLLLFAVWFLDSDRLVPFAVCAGLALLTNELMGLNIGALGLWYAFARGRRRSGLVVAGVGFLWTAFCLKVVVPAFSGESSVFYDRFETVGGSPSGILKTAFTDPGTLLTELTTWEDVRYLIFLFVPLLFLFLGSSLALVAVPQLALNLLASFESSTLPQYQYGAGAVPYLVAATVFGLAKLSKTRLRPVFAFVVASCAGLTLAAIAPSPGVDRYMLADREPAARLEALREAVALVPDDAAVSSTNRLGGQLSARRHIYSFPIRAEAGWVLVDRRDPWLSVSREQDDPAAFKSYVAQLERDGRFQLVSSRNGVLVYRRRG
jgi:uncharacterized membrane protein